jgi:hypothetical protein
MKNVSLAGLVLVASLCTAGCTPSSVALKVGMYVAGKVVDDVDTDKLGEKLIGQPESAADAELGKRNDTYDEVNGSFSWISYPVKLDPLNRNQYFVEVRNGRITRIEKLEGAGEVDLALSTFDKARVHGKSPAECQETLDAGAPELVVRSRKTGNLTQFYNGKSIAGLGDRKYIILHFDANQRCEKLKVVDVSAAAG